MTFEIDAVFFISLCICCFVNHISGSRTFLDKFINFPEKEINIIRPSTQGKKVIFEFAVNMEAINSIFNISLDKSTDTVQVDIIGLP